MNLKKILGFAMKMEKQGENFYTYYKDRVSTPSTKELFEKLAQIENQHYRLLQEKLEALGENDLKVISWVVDTNSYIKHPAIFSNQSVEMEEGDIDAAVEDLAIMRMAYSIENDFSEFYSLTAQKVDDPEARKFLEELAEWEEGHRRVFYQQYKKLLNKSWGDMESFIFPKEK